MIRETRSHLGVVRTEEACDEFPNDSRVDRCWANSVVVTPSFLAIVSFAFALVGQFGHNPVATENLDYTARTEVADIIAALADLTLECERILESGFPTDSATSLSELDQCLTRTTESRVFWGWHLYWLGRSARAYAPIANPVIGDPPIGSRGNPRRCPIAESAGRTRHTRSRDSGYGRRICE